MSGNQDAAPILGSKPLAPDHSGDYRYILGAIMVLVTVLVFLDLAAPAAKYNYLAVAGHEMAPDDIAGQLRIDDVLQTVMIVSAIILGAIFWASRPAPRRTVGLAIAAGGAILGIALLIFRSASALHLNLFFWGLTLLYSTMTALALLMAYEHLNRKHDTATASLLGLAAAAFGLSAIGATIEACTIQTGEAAATILRGLDNTLIGVDSE